MLGRLPPAWHDALMVADAEAIAQAARLLEAGKLVAIPTETVYGLAADADNPQAVAAIFSAKGRPANHPLIVHVAHGADLSHWATDVPSEAKQLMQAFWPGPLTLILKRQTRVNDVVTGGQDSIGLRCPAHPIAQALLKQFRDGQGGVAAPSANRFGRVSPTTAQHVMDEFGEPGVGPVAAVLDGGACQVGIESSIVDLTRIATHGPVLLRPGQISVQHIEQQLGRPLRLPDQAAPRVSGSLDAHYAPKTPLALIDVGVLAETLTALQARHQRVLSLCIEANVPGATRMSADPSIYAHDLYAQLRRLDQAGVDLIVVEQPPATAEWQGINDRLQRAAFDSKGVLARLLA